LLFDYVIIHSPKLNISLFFPVHSFRECLKIQSDLEKPAYSCGANSLELKCKSIKFSRLRHPVEFSYMLGCIIIDRVDSITDLQVGQQDVIC
jgi:hypothetical protein